MTAKFNLEALSNHVQRHWSLTRDPFADRHAPFVETPTHREAVARLVHTIESFGRSARLIAGAGLGKTRVLVRAIELTRDPNRRFARITAPSDGGELFSSLALALGGKSKLGQSKALAWRGLAESARLCFWQGLQVVLVVDDCQAIEASSDASDLERLENLVLDPAARLTVIRVRRPLDNPEGFVLDRGELAQDWGLSIRLVPLTRAETASYLAAKVEAAGRSEPIFTPRAITRIHHFSRGVPAGIDRIAGLALIASALRGLEMISPEVVEAVAAECLVVETAERD